MVKMNHSLPGLLIILLGGLLLASTNWITAILWTFRPGNIVLLWGGALIGFGVREILLDFSSEKHRNATEP